jgi:hypothetical protein
MIAVVLSMLFWQSMAGNKVSKGLRERFRLAKRMMEQRSVDDFESFLASSATEEFKHKINDRFVELDEKPLLYHAAMHGDYFKCTALMDAGASFLALKPEEVAEIRAKSVQVMAELQVAPAGETATEKDDRKNQIEGIECILEEMYSAPVEVRVREQRKDVLSQHAFFKLDQAESQAETEAFIKQIVAEEMRMVQDHWEETFAIIKREVDARVAAAGHLVAAHAPHANLDESNDYSDDDFEPDDEELGHHSLKAGAVISPLGAASSATVSPDDDYADESFESDDEELGRAAQKGQGFAEGLRNRVSAVSQAFASDQLEGEVVRPMTVGSKAARHRTFIVPAEVGSSDNRMRQREGLSAAEAAAIGAASSARFNVGGELKKSAVLPRLDRARRAPSRE